MKKLITIALLLISAASFGQTQYKLAYDTVYMNKTGGNSEFILRNSTRATPGFLKNIGNGRTQFITINSSNVDTTSLQTVANSQTSLNAKISYVADLTALSNYNRGSNTVAGVTDTVRGGLFTYVTSGVTANTGTIIAASGGGYWVRQFSGPVNVKWFGAVGDGVTDATTAFQSAINTGLPVFAPKGTYYITSTLTNTTGDFVLIGDASTCRIQEFSQHLHKTGTSIIYGGASSTNVLAPNPDISSSTTIKNLNIFIKTDKTNVFAVDIKGYKWRDADGMTTNSGYKAIAEVDNVGLYPQPVSGGISAQTNGNGLLNIHCDEASQTRFLFGAKFTNLFAFGVNYGIKIKTITPSSVNSGSAYFFNFINGNHFSNLMFSSVWQPIRIESTPRGEISHNVFINTQIQSYTVSNLACPEGQLAILGQSCTENSFMGGVIYDLPDGQLMIKEDKVFSTTFVDMSPSREVKHRFPSASGFSANSRSADFEHEIAVTSKTGSSYLITGNLNGDGSYSAIQSIGGSTQIGSVDKLDNSDGARVFTPLIKFDKVTKDISSSGTLTLNSTTNDGSGIITVPNNRSISALDNAAIPRRLALVTTGNIFVLGDIDNSGNVTQIKGKNSVNFLANNTTVGTISGDGLLMPRLTTAQRNAVSSPIEGLYNYNTTTHLPNFYNGTSWTEFGTNAFSSTAYLPLTGGTLSGGLSGTSASFSGGLTTNLTLGSVPFIGASGLLTQDIGNLVWDNTNKRLGIGTAGPANALDIQKSATSGGALQMQIKNTNSLGDARIKATNSAGSSVSLQATGSGYAVPNVGVISVDGTLTKLSVITDLGLANGGTSPVNFLVGGYAVTPTMTLTPGSPGKVLIGTSTDDGVNTLQVNGSIKSSQYKLSALNTAPISATDTGTLGEIRITATFIYVCTATNTWVRSALTTW